VIYLTIINYLPDGGVSNIFPPDLNLRVDNFLQGTVSHRRITHRRLNGGFYVVADPKYWLGAFTFECDDVTTEQINILRQALTQSLGVSAALLEAGDVRLLGHYVPNSLVVNGVRAMEDKRRQRNLKFSFEGKLQI
jgi:hypothetical protein